MVALGRMAGASPEGVDLFLDPGLFLDVLQKQTVVEGKAYLLPKPVWRECEVREVRGRSILVEFLTERLTEWINVDTGRCCLSQATCLDACVNRSSLLCLCFDRVQRPTDWLICMRRCCPRPNSI